MGSSISGILAILFMDTLERRALLSFPSTGLYARYVDDIFAMVENKEAANELQATMNHQHNSIKFELEHPDDDNTLRLLDFGITINADATAHFDFYKKKAKRDIFVNARSALPWSSKMNIIRNEKQRIRERCSSHTREEQHLKTFDEVLNKNGYPRQVVAACDNQPRRRKQKRENGNVLYFHMPFVSDRLNQKVRRIFHQEGFNTIVYSKNKNLRSWLTPKSRAPPSCSLNGCPISDPKLCFRKSVVYQVQCSGCNSIYIGSTIRQLHLRIKEHLTSDLSSVKRHLSNCIATTGISVSILSHDNDEKNLRLREAILIMDHKPLLNAKEEEKGLLGLVQPVKWT